MLQVCWSPKGGSGTSVVAAAIASLAAAGGRDTLLVDLAGDQNAIFGLPRGEGIGDWFAAPDDVGPEAFRSLEVDVVDRLRLLGRGLAASSDWEGDRVALAMAFLDSRSELVVIDSGRTPPEGLPLQASTTVVTRACYLGLRRLTEAPRDGARVVLIEEPGRALARRDVVTAVGEVDVVIPWDPAVARAVDAGLLATRVPRSLRPLRRLVDSSMGSWA